MLCRRAILMTCSFLTAICPCTGGIIVAVNLSCVVLCSWRLSCGIGSTRLARETLLTVYALCVTGPDSVVSVSVVITVRL